MRRGRLDVADATVRASEARRRAIVVPKSDSVGAPGWTRERLSAPNEPLSGTCTFVVARCRGGPHPGTSRACALAQHDGNLPPPGAAALIWGPQLLWCCEAGARSPRRAHTRGAWLAQSGVDIQIISGLDVAAGLTSRRPGLPAAFVGASRSAPRATARAAAAKAQKFDQGECRDLAAPAPARRVRVSERRLIRATLQTGSTPMTTSW